MNSVPMRCGKRSPVAQCRYESRGPHIWQVLLRQMWDSTDLDRRLVVSHP